MRSRRTSRFQKMRWLSNERRDRRQRQTIAGRPQSGARRIALVLACPARSILRRNRFVFREVARPWRLQTLRTRLSPRLEQVARLTEKFRCDPVTLIDMKRRSTRLMVRFAASYSRGRPLQICYPCADRYAHDGAEGAIPKHWSKAWRITCPPAASPLPTQPSIAAVVRRSSTTPFRRPMVGGRDGRAKKSSAIFADGKPAEHSPIAVLRLLLVQTWKPITGDLERPVVGWVLGTLFPNFDVRARPIKRRVTHMSIASLPIEFRPALLAGLARVSANPAVLQDLRRATLLRGQRNLDRFYREANFEPPPVHRFSPSIARTSAGQYLTIDGQSKKHFIFSFQDGA